MDQHDEYDDEYAHIPEFYRKELMKFVKPGPGMLERGTLIRLATRELIKVYGRKYLQDCYSHTCQAWSYMPDGRFFFFVGLKSQKQLPNHPADRKGWVVSASVYLDSYTGELRDIQYTKE